MTSEGLFSGVNHKMSNYSFKWVKGEAWGDANTFWSQTKVKKQNKKTASQHIHSPCAGSGWFCSQQLEESPETGPHLVSGCYGNVVKRQFVRWW